MNRVCPNVRHENITLWSSSWRLKFIHSQFPLPMSLNSVLLKCQTDTWNLFIYSVRPTRYRPIFANSANISTKSITTSHLKSLNAKIDYMTYANENPRQFPLPMSLNSVLLKCQTDTWNLFIYSVRPTRSSVIETPIRKCKHPFSRNEHLQNVEH
jgi:hypothetical protein